MSQLPTKQELRHVAKQLIVNKEVMKTGKFEMNECQTRRVISGGFLDTNEYITIKELFDDKKYDEARINWGFEARYQVGDTLWLREPARMFCNVSSILYKFDNEDFENCLNTIPSRFISKDGHITSKAINNAIDKEDWVGIPNGCIKEMARHFYKVTNVRVERLQDISDEDCIKEGIEEDTNECFNRKWYRNYLEVSQFVTCPRTSFASLWNSTAKKGYRWEDKPLFVVVYDIERVEYDN